MTDFKKKIRSRYAQRSVNNVPVSIISPDELERQSDSGLSGDAFWQRPVQALTEKEYSYIAKAVFENFVTKTPQTKNLTDKNEIIQAVSHYAEKIYTDWQMFKSGAGGGSYTITWPVMDTPDKLADATGKTDYKDRDTAIVVHKPASSPEDEISGFTGLDTSTLKPAGLDTDAWNWFMLEHELAHVAGAGEAQADAIAAARYMAETGSDDVPRKLKEVRSIMAVVQAMERVAVEQAPQRLSREKLAQTGLDNPQLRAAHVAETKRYGWGPVQALSDRLDASVAAHQVMDEDAENDLRFVSYDQRNDDLTALVHAIEKQDSGYNLYQPDFGRLMKAVDKIAAGPDSPYRDIAKGFSKAVQDVVRPETYKPAVRRKRSAAPSP